MLKIPVIIFFLIFSAGLRSNVCKDYLLLDGSAPLLGFGMDTTRHWWAITQPYTDRYNLIIDGNVSKNYEDIDKPVFSPDGETWACYVRDYAGWNVLTPDTSFQVPGTEKGAIAFAPSSAGFAYSYFENTMEVVKYGEKELKIFRRASPVYLSQSGGKAAMVIEKGDTYVVNIDGKETTTFDEIKPLGFWHDDGFLYAASNGGTWQLYKNNEAVSYSYFNIFDLQLNLAGNVYAFGATLSSGDQVCVMMSYEFRDPVVSRQFEQVMNVALHPHEPLVAYYARYRTNNYIVLNSTEYSAGQQFGYPVFTYDGSEMYFLSCEVDCYVSINGKRYSLNTQMTTNYQYAMRPQSETIAFTSSSGLIVRELKSKNIYSGTMMDEAGYEVRYNWRDRRYESLGRIRNRLYLQTGTL